MDQANDSGTEPTQSPNVRKPVFTDRVDELVEFGDSPVANPSEVYRRKARGRVSGRPSPPQPDSPNT
jgi:hypothetical protein